MKKFLLFVLCFLFIFPIFSCKKQEEVVKVYSGSVMLYSSLNENYLIALKEAFETDYPGVTLDYYYSTTERISNRLHTEMESHQINADVVFAGNFIDAERLKADGLIDIYKSKELNKIPKNLKQKDGYYSAGQVSILGLCYDENLVNNWKDLLQEKYKNKLVIANPNKAMIYKYYVMGMMQNKNYGERFFKTLKANGLKIVESANEVLDSVVSNENDVGIAVDYVTIQHSDYPDMLRFNYSKRDVIAMSTPIAIVKDCFNSDNGKLLIDYILSYKGQKILVDAGYMSVRKDFKNDIGTEKYINKLMKLDNEDLYKNGDEYIKIFNDIMVGE